MTIFKNADTESSLFVYREYGSRSYMKFLESRSRWQEQKVQNSLLTQCKTSIDDRH